MQDGQVTKSLHLEGTFKSSTFNALIEIVQPEMYISLALLLMVPAWFYVLVHFWNGPRAFRYKKTAL